MVIDTKAICVLAGLGLVLSNLYAESDIINLDSNRVYRVCKNASPNCVLHENSAYTTITNATIDRIELKVALALADVFVRKLALRTYCKPRIQTDATGRRFVQGHDYVREFPKLLPREFEIYGLPYDKLSITVLPYVVLNRRMSGCLKGVLCEYRLDGEFKFALYVCLNTNLVSPDFVEVSSCPMTVALLGRYPYLEKHIREQKAFSRYVMSIMK